MANKYYWNPATNSIEKREDPIIRIARDLVEQKRVDDKALLFFGEKQDLLARYA